MWRDVCERCALLQPQPNQPNTCKSNTQHDGQLLVHNGGAPQVMPFITANISKNTAPADWRLREAATVAFGLILEGPEPAAIHDTAKQALAYLLNALRDPNSHVKVRQGH